MGPSIAAACASVSRVHEIGEGYRIDNGCYFGLHEGSPFGLREEQQHEATSYTTIGAGRCLSGMRVGKGRHADVRRLEDPLVWSHNDPELVAYDPDHPGRRRGSYPSFWFAL
jgi:hypothetical protein